MKILQKQEKLFVICLLYTSAKWLIGSVAFAGAVALTALTGGALAPVFIGMGVSIVSGALIQGTINAIHGNDFWQGAADGAADGAMWGGIFALVGASIGAIKYGLSAKGAVHGTQHLDVYKRQERNDVIIISGRGNRSIFCKDRRNVEIYLDRSIVEEEIIKKKEEDNAN